MSQSAFSPRRRAILATCGLFAATATLFALRADDGAGVSADDLDAVIAEVGPEADATGAFVLDLVEPDDGEGGSETEIAQFVHELDARLDLDVAAAGFYSHGEHLFRMTGDATALQAAVDRLDEHPLIEGIEPELIYSLPTDTHSAAGADDAPGIQKPDRFVPDDPMFGLQWHMEQIKAPEAWTKNRGSGAIVAVIDTGVAYKDAKGAKALPDLAQTKFTEGESFVNGGLKEGLDDHAHGSHVAGTIAQSTNNGVGVTGVAFESTIMPLKVLSRDGRGSVTGIANAIRYAADHGAHVINMSLGGPLPSRVLAKAIEYAHKKGVTTVCAAGNESRGRVGYPAANDYAVAVAAVDYGRKPTFYTNWGKAIDIAAPGGDTRSDKNGDGHPDGVLQNTIQIQRPMDNDYLWFQGTSMASPHAAGVAALIVSAGVTNPDEVERILKDTAVHPQGKKWDERYGAGIIDADAAVSAALGHHAPERGLLGGLLALLALAGLGVAGLGSGRKRLLGALGAVAGFGLGAGIGVTPLAYGIAGAFGAAAIGSPLWLSAAVPVAATLALLSVKPLRGLLTGLSIGYAGLLAHGALVLPTVLDALPGGPTIDRLWLAANAVVCVALARKLSKL